MSRHDITDQAKALEVDEAVELILDGEAIAICRGEAGLFAVANTCTHAEARLTDGFLFENSIECPLHQARYDLSNGALLEGPDCPALRTFVLTEADGRVFVELP
ncbi:MAG: Rieske 2Fe-2S domain-containing protein [Burkholderiaceae bacterium]